MKRTIAVCTLLLVGFLAGALTIGIPAGAGGQVDPEGRGSTGDTNGDGLVDMSDAIYLLSHLFNGGPQPAACGDSPELVDRVVALEANLIAVTADVGEIRAGLQGLAESLDSHGDEIDDLTARLSESETEIGALRGGLGESCEKTFDRWPGNGDGTVTDTCTGLMWRSNAVRGVTIGQAFGFAANATFAGYDDWRLPTVFEAYDLKGGRDGGVPIGPGFGEGWTSTSDPSRPDHHFRGTDSVNVSSTLRWHVDLVRDPQ